MTSLAGVLCRFWKCARGSGETRASGHLNSGDDLKLIRGIGIATENRLYGAGIRSYAELARATPAELRKILGRVGPDANLEAWIKEARKRSSRR